jgi:hypothetical protein
VGFDSSTLCSPVIKNELVGRRITMLIAQRVAARYLRTASRPIRLDKAAIKRVVDEKLLPDVRRWLEDRLANGQEGKIGTYIRNTVSATLPLKAVGKGGSLHASIRFTFLNSASEDAVLGGAATLETGLFGMNDEVQVVLRLNGGLTPGEFLSKRMQTTCSNKKCLSYGLYSVLIHELTHVTEMPYLRHDPSYNRDDDGQLDKAKYYNSAMEVRAFMQQVVDETVLWAGRAFPRVKIKDGSNRSFVDELLKLSPTWQRVETYMTAANRKKILSAVYDALSREGLLLEPDLQAR